MECKSSQECDFQTENDEKRAQFCGLSEGHNGAPCKSAYLPCLNGSAALTLSPVRFGLRPLHSDPYVSGGDLVLCWLRLVHSLNIWLRPVVPSGAAGLLLLLHGVGRDRVTVHR